MQIKTKFSLAMIFVVLLSHISFSYVGYRAEKQILMEGIKSKLETVVHIIQENMETYHNIIEDRTSISPDTHSRLNQYHNRLLNKLGLNSICTVLYIDGKFVSTSSTKINKNIELEFFRELKDQEKFAYILNSMKPYFNYEKNNKEDIYALYYPFIDSFGKPYIIKVSEDNSDINMLINQSIIASLLSSIIICILSIILSFIISESITKSIKQVSKIADKIANGDHRQILPLNGTYEINLLISSINTMSKAIECQINKLKNSRDRLNHLRKIEIIGNLATGIVHDFNNIITPIKGYAEFIKEDCKECRYEGNASCYAMDIVSATDKAIQLINQIKYLSKHNSSEKELLKLNLIVKDAVKLLVDNNKDINITYKLNRETRVVYANAIQIHQVVTNLLQNAIDAVSDNNGRIKVLISNVEIKRNAFGLKNGKYVRLSILDNGTGIKKEIRDKIFEPYYTTKNVRGTGMGLSIVDSIVADHKGKIIIRSKEGRGTWFMIFFPVNEIILD